MEALLPPLARGVYYPGMTALAPIGGSKLTTLTVLLALCYALGATRTSVLPKLRPSNILMKASEAFSRPSVMSSQ